MPDIVYFPGPYHGEQSDSQKEREKVKAALEGATAKTFPKFVLCTTDGGEETYFLGTTVELGTDMSKDSPVVLFWGKRQKVLRSGRWMDWVPPVNDTTTVFSTEDKTRVRAPHEGTKNWTIESDLVHSQDSPNHQVWLLKPGGWPKGLPKP